MIAVSGSGTALSAAAEPQTAIIKQGLVWITKCGLVLAPSGPMPAAGPLCVANCSELYSVGEGGAECSVRSWRGPGWNRAGDGRRLQLRRTRPPTPWCLRPGRRRLDTHHPSASHIPAATASPTGCAERRNVTSRYAYYREMSHCAQGV